MTSYGHSLRFGVFLTPAAVDPGTTVALAVHTETVGLDLVSFQDHPYQPAFLDTWTLLAWVAARTTRIHISGAVLSIPLRPAPILAKAAASLDRLSHGRVELGIGPGAFWEAITTLGVPRQTPAESVTALEESIYVIRALWDTTQAGPAHAGGSLVHVNAAKRGPAPAHHIPIVLGAYKPRMLRLTGTLADGWISSLNYLQAGELEHGNSLIDAAAVAAGRSPNDIERYLIVPPHFTATELAPLVEAGISTFLISTDDRATIERWAKEAGRVRR